MAALRLGGTEGWIWIIGTGCLSFVGLILYLLDPGAAKSMQRDRWPKARGAQFARLVLLVCIVQLPPIAWRVAEGDPLERAAKAYVETHHEAWRGRARSTGPVQIILEGTDVPELLADGKLRAGVSDGEPWFEFDHHVYGIRRFDVGRRRWRTLE